MDSEKINAVLQHSHDNKEKIIAFMCDIVSIPSMRSQIRDVGERIMREMEALGFDEVRFDIMGNVIGRIGNGGRVLVYDSHIDTVDVGDLADWPHDPFRGKIENGVLYARGACDEKGSTPGMVYGLTIARDLGLLDGWSAYYFGNMEEWCDGIAPNAFVEADPKVRPDFVVIGEPTKMNVYRGHKGRIELKITAKGKSAHAASNHLGDNAIYTLLPVIEGIRHLEPKLGIDAFLGQGKITVSDMQVKTPSINAVPNEASIFIDRRMTFGETKEDAIAQIEALIPSESKTKIKVEQLFYDEPSYTGFVFPVDKYYPAWAVDEDHVLVRSGLQTLSSIELPANPAGKWDFSTNGTYWAGKAGIPCIGFGPGDETTAHSLGECISLTDVARATEFYALLPAILNTNLLKKG